MTLNQDRSMTARSIGSATIAFGLVSIPVKLYSTKGEERKISFNMLHEPGACAAAKEPDVVGSAPTARLQQQHVCTRCEEVVDKDHTVKGYEHAKGQYVILTAADLEALEPDSTNRIDVEMFVERGEVDPLYVETSYYLAPDKGAEAAYGLLREAMFQSEREAIARYAARGREHVVHLRVHPAQPIIVLHQLRYAHEVRGADEVPIDAPDPASDLLELGKAIVRENAGCFEPSLYIDASYERTKKLIEGKVETGQILATTPPAAPPTVIDLMAALRASIKETTPAPSVDTAAPARTRAARAISAAKKRTTAKAKPKTKAAAKRRQPIRKLGR